MIADHHTHTELERLPWRREVLRWGAAALVVCAAHGAAAYTVMALAEPFEPPAVEESMEVELASLSISSAEPVKEEAAEVELPEQLAEDPDLPTEQPEIVEETEVQEEPDTIEPEEVEPLETAKAEVLEEIEPEPIPETPEAVVALPQPRPEIVEETVEDEKPKPRKPKPRKVEKAPTVKTEKRPTKSRQVDAGGAAQKAMNASLYDRWKARVQSAVHRRKPRGGAEKGTLVVMFVVDRSGNIISSRITSSSGNGKLDSAALGMVRNARIPAPPPELGITREPFSIKVTFE